MDARSAVLARIGQALGRSQQAPAPAPARDYVRQGEHPAGSAEVVELFLERVADYRAQVHTTTAAALPGLVATLLRRAGTVVVPPGLPASWVTGLRDAGATLLTDAASAPLTHGELDAAGAVLTAARTAVAPTGTVVLDHQEDQGRRALTLLPDHHVCVLRADQVQPTLPQAMAVLREHPGRPMTFVAGPSATSDIELVRVEGVHGPRNLDVVVVLP